MTKKAEDLVPYYRPGTTEPEMVPRGSVPGTGAIAEGAEPVATVSQEPAAEPGPVGAKGKPRTTRKAASKTPGKKK
jgi:hypothetical protein